MVNDDEQIGRVLSRREALRLMAAASAAMLAGRVTRENGTPLPTSTAAPDPANTAGQAVVPTPTLAAATPLASVASSTAGQMFLRGYQVTDENGQVQFATIYPGWYAGQTVHIHFKIRTDPGSAAGHGFTSQLYFDDALSNELFAQEPYASKGVRTTGNEDDGIYRNGGEQLMLNVVPDGDGYVTTFDIGLQLS